MMAPVRHVTSRSELRKFQTDGFLSDRVYPYVSSMQCACAISVPRSIDFFHIISNGTIFEKTIIDHKMCVSSFSTTFVRNIFHYKMK